MDHASLRPVLVYGPGVKGNMAALSAEGQGNRFIVIAVETNEPVPVTEPGPDCQKVAFSGGAVRGLVEVIDARLNDDAVVAEWAGRAIGGGSIGAGVRLISRGDDLCMFDGTTLYTYSDTLASWKAIEPLLAGEVTQRTVVQPCSPTVSKKRSYRRLPTPEPRCSGATPTTASGIRLNHTHTISPTLLNRVGFGYTPTSPTWSRWLLKCGCRWSRSTRWRASTTTSRSCATTKPHRPSRCGCATA